MRKGRLLVVLSLLAIAAMFAAIGTGAVDMFTARRSSAVSVVNDAEGFIAISSESDWAKEVNGQLNLNFTESNTNADGEGFNRNSITEVYEVFTVTNQSTQDVYVWLEAAGWTEQCNEILTYIINQDETTGDITKGTHSSHSKYDMLGKFVYEYENGIASGIKPPYVLLAPGEAVTFDIKADTASGWYGKQSEQVFPGDLDHTVIVKADADAPVWQ